VLPAGEHGGGRGRAARGVPVALKCASSASPLYSCKTLPLATSITLTVVMVTGTDGTLTSESS
jgi:hypothetical protein